MNFSFVGTNSFATDILYTVSDGFIFTTDSATDQEVVFRSVGFPDITVTLTGTFQIADTDVTGGTITRAEFIQAGVTQTILTEISWDYADFTNAILQAVNAASFEASADLLSSNGPITVDASSALAGYHQEAAWGDIVEDLTQPIDFLGSQFADVVRGTPLNDLIRPGSNSFARDLIFGSDGDDFINFTDADTQTQYLMIYDGGGTPIVVDIDSENNRGTIEFAGSTDRLLQTSRAVSSDPGGPRAGHLGIDGTEFGDTFNIALQANDSVRLFGNEGTDSYELDIDGADVLLVFTFGDLEQPTQGLSVDLLTGEVFNDGFGNVEDIDIIGTPRLLSIQGTSNVDVVSTGLNDEYIALLDGDDVVTAGHGGEDIIVGGEGNDTAIFDALLGALTVSFDQGASVVVERSREDVSTALIRVESLSATDETLDLTKHDGISLISAEDLTALTELYIAYFDRAADALGLSFWATAFQSKGFSLRDIADQFFTQPETVALYENVTDGAFVKAVYNNVLGRDPDDPGLVFWTDQLSSGNITESEFILELLAGARAATGSPADVAFIEGKTDLGVYYAVIQGQNNLAAAQSVMDAFDGTEDGTAAAIGLSVNALAFAETSETELLLPVVGVVDDPFLTFV